MERPILFNGEMVRAILAGRKTQTRRTIKPQPAARARFQGWIAWAWDDTRIGQASFTDAPRKCPYGIPGDMLWVRETWAEIDGNIVYRSTDDAKPPKWQPSIFMRRKHSRITLEILRVRVERLQEITEQDAQAEGVERTNDGMWRCYGNCHEHGGGYLRRTSATASYMSLWNRINGREFHWDTNPLVWVVEFERVQNEQEMQNL